MTNLELKQFRKSKNMSQTDFAQYLGLKRYATVCEYESAKTPVPLWIVKRIEAETNKINQNGFL